MFVLSKKMAFGCLLFVGMGLTGCASSSASPKPASSGKNEVIAPKSVVADPVLLPVSFATLPGWDRDQVGAALPALQRSCNVFAKRPADKNIGPYGIGGTVGDWQPICEQAFSLNMNDGKAVRQFFESYFQPYLVSDQQNEEPPRGLFTGYYEAGLRGAKSKGGPYQTPLYKRPKDLVLVGLGEFKQDWRGKRLAGKIQGGRLVPYADRSEIEAGKLQGKDLELVWVDDPVDAFFLHIQGSGRVQFSDGSTMRVGYDGHNGHDYVSIGRILIERGEVSKEDMSMQAIRKWLAANPKKGQDLMRENGSFIFFKKLTGEGPIGAQGVALTPGRSLAIDKRYLPLGVPVWLYSFTDPMVENAPIARLLVTQDTGGAIKGVVRGDVFWGYGQQAAERAGLMKERGSYYVLLPNNSLSRCQVCQSAEQS